MLTIFRKEVHRKKIIRPGKEVRMAAAAGRVFEEALG